MKTYTVEELKTVVAAHQKWKNGEPGGVRADLSGAYLSGANLSGADLSGVNLRSADLDKCVLPPTLIVPEEGSFIVWKKVFRPNSQEVRILKLRVEEDAGRVNSTKSRKCRASKALVLAAFNQDRTPAAETSFQPVSGRPGEYVVGQVTEAMNWNPDFREECTGGIHFFLTRAEAEAYSDF